MGALTLFAACKGRSVPMNAVAREYALDLADGAFSPDVIMHLPGICNVVADALSRRMDPAYSKDWITPAFLSNAKEISLPDRPRSWWKALYAPSVAKKQQLWGAQS